MLRSTPIRPLVAVYALTLLAAVCEFLRGPASLHEEPDIYGDPIRNFPEAMARLFPERPETEYLLGRRLESVARRNIDRDELQRDPELRRRFLSELNVALQDAARHYARALSLGLKSEENLQYSYALTLIRIQADPQEIDRAIAAWRRNFPHSNRRDLELQRRTIERQLRQLSPKDALPAGEGDPQRKRDGRIDRAALETGGVDQRLPSRKREHLDGCRRHDFLSNPPDHAALTGDACSIPGIFPIRSPRTAFAKWRTAAATRRLTFDSGMAMLQRQWNHNPGLFSTLTKFSGPCVFSEILLISGALGWSPSVNCEDVARLR